MEDVAYCVSHSRKSQSIGRVPQAGFWLCVWVDKGALAMIGPLALSLCCWHLSRVPQAPLRLFCDTVNLRVEGSSETNQPLKIFCTFKSSVSYLCVLLLEASKTTTLQRCFMFIQTVLEGQAMPQRIQLYEGQGQSQLSQGASQCTGKNSQRYGRGKGSSIKNSKHSNTVRKTGTPICF